MQDVLCLPKNVLGSAAATKWDLLGLLWRYRWLSQLSFSLKRMPRYLRSFTLLRDGLCTWQSKEIGDLFLREMDIATVLSTFGFIRYQVHQATNLFKVSFESAWSWTLFTFLKNMREKKKPDWNRNRTGAGDRHDGRFPGKTWEQHLTPTPFHPVGRVTQRSRSGIVV